MAVGLVSTGVQFPDSTIQTTAASASALVLVNSQSLSGAASYTITTGFSSTYDDYYFILSALTPSVSGTDLNARLRKGTSVATSSYDDRGSYAFGGGLILLGSYSSYIPMVNNTSANQPISVYGYLINVNSTGASAQSLFMNSLVVQSGSVADYVSVGGSNSFTGAVTGIHFYISSGTFTGNFKLYGIAK